MASGGNHNAPVGNEQGAAAEVSQRAALGRLSLPGRPIALATAITQQTGPDCSVAVTLCKLLAAIRPMERLRCGGGARWLDNNWPQIGLWIWRTSTAAGNDDDASSSLAGRCAFRMDEGRRRPADEDDDNIGRGSSTKSGTSK